MKKTFLLSVIMILVLAMNSQAQINFDTITATYTAGDIQTDHDFLVYGDVSSCPATLNVPVPNNALVYSVNVDYAMTALAPQSMAQQRSQLWCTTPTGTHESAVYSGAGYTSGTLVYDRTGLSIAYGIKPIFGLGVNFQFHAGSIYYNQVDCSAAGNKVDNNTWTVTVIYLPAGSPGFPNSPTPPDNQLLVDLNANLSWSFGTSSSTYDVYFGTDNPPATKVINNATVSGGTGAFDPGTMLASTTYYWQMVAKNAANNTPGPVWSFSTACNTSYPYYENFDGVTAPDFPPCWVPLSSSSSQYTKVKSVNNPSVALSDPNYIVFSAEDELNPNLVLVLPNAGIISEKMITLNGKNDIDGSGSYYDYPIQIGTITDPFNINTFTSFDSFIPGGNWTIHETYFINYPGNDNYIAIKGVVPQFKTIYLDDVTVEYIPDCVKPLNVTATEIEAEQATISWTDLNGAGSWNVEYGIHPYTPTGVPVLTGVSNPCVLTGLQPAEYYDIYVQTNCGPDGLSDWSFPLTVLTECSYSTVPILEDFGIITSNPPWPLCWSHIDSDPSANGEIKVSSYNAYSGSGVWMRPLNYQAQDLILISPKLAPAINMLRATFKARTYNLSDQKALIIGTITDTTDATLFYPMDTISLDNTYETFTIYFNDFPGSDNYIAWRHNSDEYPSQDVFIDEVLIEDIPSCVEPYKSWITNVSSNYGTLNWFDPLANNTDFVIEAGLVGFTPGTGSATNTYTYHTDTPASIDSYQMTGLTPATNFDVYVRANCGGGNYSIWTGPVTLYTGFNAFTLPVAENFEGGLGITGNNPGNQQDWVINNTLQHSGMNSILNPYGASCNNILNLQGTFNLAGKTNAMLSFWHIAKTDGQYDHCYVEISADGGVTFDQLPVSAYYGAGLYRETNLFNNPEGPCFDEDSYTDWGTGTQTPTNAWWKKEYFSLIDYNAFNNVVIRFRLYSNATNNKAGWYIDDIAIENLGVPDFTIDPLSISKEASAVAPIANQTVNLTNPGTFPAYYTASVVYDETTAFNENFNSGTLPAGWTIENYLSDALTWTITNNTGGYSFNGTYHASVTSNVAAAATTLMKEGLVSPTVNLSSWTYGSLEFMLSYDDEDLVPSDDYDTARVFIYNGTSWLMLAQFTADVSPLSATVKGALMKYDISSYLNPDFRVKFWYTNGSKRCFYMAVDDVRVRVSNTTPIGWLTINGTELQSGIAMPDALGLPLSSLDVQFNSTGINPGTYNAGILITSTDPTNLSTLIPVQFTVGIVVDLKVFLEGSYNSASDLMNTNLNSASLIPLSQPYNPTLPYYGNGNPDWLYAGTESVSAVPAGVVDWVIVQLRDAANASAATPATIIPGGTQAGFLLSSGSIVARDGVSKLFFPTGFSQQLFAVVYHRNHLGIITATPISQTSGIYTYDFTTGSDKVLGESEGYIQIDASPVMWGMMSGDCNASGNINLTDKTAAWTTEAGKRGYCAADTDMNGQADNIDKNGLVLKNLNKSSQIPE